MAPQLLAFLDDALSELREAHRRFAAQKALPDEKRSLLSLAPAMRSAYVAVEKLFKHALAAIDPYLVYSDLKPSDVRSVVKDVRASGSPSPLASRTSLRTLTLWDAWLAVQELNLLPLEASALSQFGSTLKQLTAVRRQVQHAEIWAAPVELLSLLEQLFAQMRAVGNTLVADFEARLSSVDAELPLALRAIEERVDKGWIHLQELLAKRCLPTFDVKVITSLRAPGHDLELVLHADNSPNYLFGITLIPRTQATGLFAAALDNDQIQSRADLMSEDLPLSDVPDSDIPAAPPPPTGILGVLFAAEDESTRGLREALMRSAERRRLAIERFGLKPLEDGSLTLPRTPVWGHWVDPASPKLTMLSQLLLQDLEIRYCRGDRAGQVQSLLLPSPALEGAASAKPLQVTGTCWMTGEYVADEKTASEAAPPGTTLRFHRARLTVSETA